jgi:hypothetical protein
MGSVRKRPTGRWEARWYAPDGRQHSRHFSTKGDATRHMRLMEGEKERGDYLDHRLGRTLFRDVAEAGSRRSPRPSQRPGPGTRASSGSTSSRPSARRLLAALTRRRSTGSSLRSTFNPGRPGTF